MKNNIVILLTLIAVIVASFMLSNNFGVIAGNPVPGPRPVLKINPEPTIMPTVSPQAEVIVKAMKVVNVKPKGTDIFSLMNYQREKLHIKPLIYNKTLEKTAYAKACSILNSGFWSHSLPDGRTYDRFMRDNGATMFRDLGENLSRKFSPNEAMKNWMASPGHRQNILDSRWKYAGVGSCGSIIAVHFAR